jgi:hypothetical protein
MHASAGTHPKVTQEIMRHSSVELTMALYTDGNLLDIAEAVEALPELPSCGIADESAANEDDQQTEPGNASRD